MAKFYREPQTANEQRAMAGAKVDSLKVRPKRIGVGDYNRDRSRQSSQNKTRGRKIRCNPQSWKDSKRRKQYAA